MIDINDDALPGTLMKTLNGSGADVCTMMQSSLGHLSSVALLRKLSMVVFIFKVVGSDDSAKEIAYQIMNVVEARGQIDDDAAIDESFETLQKIFNTTHGSRDTQRPECRLAWPRAQRAYN